MSHHVNVRSSLLTRGRALLGLLKVYVCIVHNTDGTREYSTPRRAGLWREPNPSSNVQSECRSLLVSITPGVICNTLWGLAGLLALLGRSTLTGSCVDCDEALPRPQAGNNHTPCKLAQLQTASQTLDTMYPGQQQRASRGLASRQICLWTQSQAQQGPLNSTQICFCQYNHPL